MYFLVGLLVDVPDVREVGRRDGPVVCYCDTETRRVSLQIPVACIKNDLYFRRQLKRKTEMKRKTTMVETEIYVRLT